jgi:RNA polymerase sigma-70 factor, ECF subfamily
VNTNLKKEKTENVIYKEYYTQINRFFRKKINSMDDADDLTIETLNKVLTKIDSYNSDYPFEKWVWSIVNNHLIDYFRKINTKRYQVNKNLSDVDDIINTGGTATTDMEFQLLLDEVNIILSNLPDVDMAIFNLSIFEGLDNIDIAKQLGISKSRVKHRLLDIKKIVKNKINTNDRRIY